MTSLSIFQKFKPEQGPSKRSNLDPRSSGKGELRPQTSAHAERKCNPLKMIKKPFVFVGALEWGGGGKNVKGGGKMYRGGGEFLVEKFFGHFD